MPFLVSLTIILCLVAAWLHLVNVLHYFQIEEYDNIRFLRWCAGNWGKVSLPIELAIVPICLALSVIPASAWSVATGLTLWGAALLANGLLLRRRSVKKPLVYTARVKRLLSACLLLVLAGAYLLGVAKWSSPYRPSTALVYLACLIVVCYLAAVIVILGNILLFPFEELLRVRYIWSAKKKLRSLSPFVIGITGSYGKTSTKEILAGILSSRYDVLRTPKSFNTIMGICKVIREDLKPQHRYFVVELGAYKPGEIKRLCELVRPRIGILTAVGPQHLERFKSIENVARAKNELIEALPSDGVAVFNADDSMVLDLSHKATVKTLRYGVTSSKGVDICAQDIRVQADGMRFQVARGGQLPAVPFRTVLLGRHNVSNILAATLAAAECGMSYAEIAHAVSMIPAIDHRLQLVKGPNGITYIDDAYNANPIGAHMALEVLSAFEGRKFLVTPGFVELGSIEERENERLGQAAARVCDFIILVGARRRVTPILKGIEQAGFPHQNVFVFDSLSLAQAALRQMAQPGDVFLFENDLPDTY